MSKSIYEEALEIMIDNILPREGSKVNKTKVIKALLQAQKQEKLLNKIKEIIDRPGDSIITSVLKTSNSIIYSNRYYSNRYYEIEKLIKELENE